MFIIDFIFTYYSVYVAKYAIELNPLVVLITPFGALILNIFIAYYMRYNTITNTIITGILFIFYGSANLNHFSIFLTLLK